MGSRRNQVHQYPLSLLKIGLIDTIVPGSKIAEPKAKTPLIPPANVRDHHHEHGAHNTRGQPPGIGVLELFPGGAAKEGQGVWVPVAVPPVFRLCDVD